MLVHDPHNLAGVHCGTAADGDNAVRLEGGHRLGAFLCAGEGRVGRNIVERGVDDAQLIQLVGNRLGEAGFEQERVGDDEAALLAHNCLEFIQGDRQAALLEVDLFRRTEPQHILPPDGNSLDVQQVLDADVLRDGVAAPRAAAQRQRRTQHEVVQVADAALRGRRVDENTAGLHARGEAVNQILAGDGVQVDRRGVAVAAVSNQVLRLVERIVDVLGAVHRQHGRELLMRELFGNIHGFDFTNQHLGGFRHVHARELGNGVRLLTDNLGIQRAVDDDGLAHLVQLFAFEEVRAALGELRLHRVVDAVQYDGGLLGRADHAVVERLGVQDGVDGHLHVSGFVDNRGRVASADAQGRLAGGVRRLDHAGAAGGKDDVGFLHRHVGQLQRGNIDPRDDVFGRAGSHSGFQHNLRGGDGGLLRARMGRDDDAVAGLEANQRLENGGRCGVGGRDDRRDNADRFCNLHHAECFVALQHADGLRVLVGVVDVFSGVVVLDDLIFHHTHAGFFHRHLRQRDAHVVRGEGSCLENLVHLLLRVGRIDLLCRADAGEGRLEALHVIDDRILFRHDTLSLCFIRSAGMRPRTGNVGVCRGDENSVADC